MDQDDAPQSQSNAHTKTPLPPRSVADLRSARESRATSALKMKDTQLSILTTQNNALLSSLDQAEEEANDIQMSKLAVEEENRTLRDVNFDVISKSRASDSELKKVQSSINDKTKQLTIMTSQNSELLRLLETEEAQTGKLAGENESFRSELFTFRGKYGALLTTAKTHEEMAARAAREGALRAEEVRLLRAEVEQFKSANGEMKMKSTIELESLHDQLRIRKEKQYQLMEKMQGLEEGKRQAEDSVGGMEDKLRVMHGRNVDVETQLQVESRAKRGLEETNKIVQVDLANVQGMNKELSSKIEKSELERLRMEAEGRDSGEQLREMAEKVFQLLERLKLAELGKSRSMEALRKKESEMLAMNKKNTRLIKESTKEGKARVKAELDKKVLQDQIRALKRHNGILSVKCREEVKGRIKEHEERVEAQEKVRTLGGRLSFLLNKMQSDEEGKIISREETKKMEAKLKAVQERCEELQGRVEETGESNRVITQALRVKQEEGEGMRIRIEAMRKVAEEGEEERRTEGVGEAEVGARPEDSNGATGGDANNAESKMAGGKLRFYVDSKPTLGLTLIKGKRSADRLWLESKDCNAFLKRCQKTANFKDMLIGRVAEMYGLLMCMEEEAARLNGDVGVREEEISHLTSKTVYYADKLAMEEESKRRTLLRYVHAVKAASGSESDGKSEHDNDSVGSKNNGRITLPESGITDEEVHAIAAMLRGNLTITSLNLRGNQITDEGARALAAVLNGRSALKVLDLRGNRIGRVGVKAAAEALERSERVRHVYVHAGGKIEALGSGMGLSQSQGQSDGQGEEGGGGAGPMVTVETVCVVDMRENNPPEDVFGAKTEKVDKQITSTSTSNSNSNGANSPSPFALSSLSGIQDTNNNNSNTSNSNSNTNRPRQKSTERHARNERERKRQLRLIQLELDKENSMKEVRWDGRAGGLEVSLNSSLDGGRKKSGGNGYGNGSGRNMNMDTLPPVNTRPDSSGGELVRSSSAGAQQSASLMKTSNNSKSTGAAGAGFDRRLMDSPLMKNAGPNK